jgi:hypothetical protein
VVNKRTVNSINALVRFCARRDVPARARGWLAFPVTGRHGFGGAFVQVTCDQVPDQGNLVITQVPDHIFRAGRRPDAGSAAGVTPGF